MGLSLAHGADWVATRPFAFRASLCFVFGVLGALALPPFSWPVFFILPFAGFVFLLRTVRNIKQSFLCGWLYALGYHLAGLYWISASLFVDISRYFWVLPFSLLALPAYLALLFAAACMLAHPLRKKTVRHALALTSLLFFSEILRGILLTGFPWNSFGYIWVEALPLLQSVGLFGIHGLTLLTLLVASSLSLALKPTTRWGYALIALSFGMLSALSLYGMIRLDATPTSFYDHIMVRLVQPDIKQEERRSAAKREENFFRILQLSNAKPQNPDKPITHIIWAETASPYFLEMDQGARAAVGHAVPKGGAIITGTPSRREDSDGHRYYNSLVVVDDQATLVGIYDKTHLVPFGEFIPLHRLLNAMPIAADVIGNQADFSSGDGAKTLLAPSFPPFAPMICYEAIFSGTIADTHNPPQLLLQITNDAWFGDTTGPYQHAQMTKVRAIEEGLPLLRVANSGISMVVDPMGRILASLPLGTQGVVDSSVPRPLTQSTLFQRHKNNFAYVMGMFLMLCAFLPVSSHFKQKS